MHKVRTRGVCVCVLPSQLIMSLTLSCRTMKSMTSQNSEVERKKKMGVGERPFKLFLGCQRCPITFHLRISWLPWKCTIAFQCYDAVVPRLLTLRNTKGTEELRAVIKVAVRDYVVNLGLHGVTNVGGGEK